MPLGDQEVSATRGEAGDSDECRRGLDRRYGQAMSPACTVVRAIAPFSRACKPASGKGFWSPIVPAPKRSFEITDRGRAQLCLPTVCQQFEIGTNTSYPSWLAFRLLKAGDEADPGQATADKPDVSRPRARAAGRVGWCHQRCSDMHLQTSSARVSSCEHHSRDFCLAVG